MKIALLAADYELGRYAHSLSHLQDMEWVGYCLTSGDQTHDTHFSPTAKLPRMYSSPQQLAVEADLVVVAGHPEDRFDHISGLLRRGKCVWSEWPLSTAEAKVRKLAALAEEARVCNQVAHPGRKHPLWMDALPHLKQTGAVRCELSLPECPDLAHAIDHELFPYLDRVLSLDDSPVKKLNAHKLKTAAVGKFSAQVEMELRSGLLAEFWMSNVMPDQVEQMRCMKDETVVDLDFVALEWSLQNGGKGGQRKKVRMDSCDENIFDTFLLGDLQSFTQACRNRKQGSLNFAESGQVQELLFQIRHILL